MTCCVSARNTIFFSLFTPFFRQYSGMIFALIKDIHMIDVYLFKGGPNLWH